MRERDPDARDTDQEWADEDLAPLVRDEKDMDPAEQADLEERRRPVPGHSNR